jgi:hypothetical protein
MQIIQPGLIICSIKRSPPMTEAEARAIAEDSHLFGYKPDIIQLNNSWHLNIRGDGSDDQTVRSYLARLRGSK